MTESESSEHFTRRLESFSDIVFGFSLSLLTSRLVVPERANDVFGHPSGLIGFVATFATLVSFWFLNHRMFRDFYTAQRVDTLLVFVELAGVALMPYALAIAIRFSFLQQQPLVLYDGVFLAVFGSNALIGGRGFRRRFAQWNEAKRRANWRRVVVQSIVASLFALSIPFALLFPGIGWAPYWLIVPTAVFLRRFLRGLPAFARVDDAAR